MAYIGRNPAIGTQKVLDSLESQFNGTLTTFDLRYNTNTIYPTIASALIVSLGGVLQEPGSAYNVASDQITFAAAPPAGTDCWILLYSEFGGQAGATANLTVSNNLTIGNELRGPANFIIDPAAVGDDTGTLEIKGNLTVQGTTTTINSTTLTVDDKNIVLASGATNNVAADGAGITIDTANATLLYKATPDAWSFNKNVGIDTNNPQAKLDVNGLTKSGGFQATGNVTPTTGQGVEIFSPSSSQGMIQAFDRGGASQMELKLRGSDVTFFGTSNTDERLRITGAGLVRVPDNGKFTAGAGDDLQIYHDGTDSIIDNTNGDLYLKTTGSGDDIIIRAADDVIIQTQGSEGAVIARGDGTVELYYDNSKKFETTTTGAKVTGALEVTQEYPTIRPTLDLNFAATKTLDRRITFTRDSLGTYTDELGIIRYASNNVPRFDHDPTTGESLGLLIEESRTNSFTYSQPTSAVSFASNGTFTYNSATAPNGETEAFRVARNGSNSSNSYWRATGAINFNADAMVLSVWAKGDGGNNYFVWSFQNLGGAIVRAGFKLEGDGETSIITNGNGGHTLQIEKYPDGWYRCIIIGNTDSSGSTTQFLYTASSYSESYSVVGGSVLLWGFQLEPGSFATSYIPTSGTTATRAADTAKITGTNFTDFFNKDEGTLFVNYKLDKANYLYSPAGADLVTFKADSNSGRYSIRIVSNTSTPQLDAHGIDDSTAQYDIVGIHLSDGLKDYLVAKAFKLNDMATSFNGAAPQTDGSVTVVEWDKLLIGADPKRAHYKSVKYYNKRLPNAQLQGLTQQ